MHDGRIGAREAAARPRRRLSPLSIRLAATVLLLTATSAAPAQEPAHDADRQRIEAVVGRLASPAMQGRRGEGAEKAAAYLVDEFRRIGLEPLFDGKFTQPIPGKEPGTVQGTNLGAMIRGADPKLKDDWVIVAAHYDHLGVRRGVLYPGADDNATGVAMMLEAARAFASAGAPPRRSVAFIGFDLEEIGLFGSRYLVAHPPMPLERVALFITADMIGRAMMGVCKQQVFVLGTEHAPGLRAWIDEAARDRPVRVSLLGSDVLILNRSDYGPFRTRQVPYLFFSTGENPCYHSPDDRPETIDYAKATVITRIIRDVARSAADAAETPRWNPNPDNPLAEAATIRDVLKELLGNERPLKLSGAAAYLMRSTLGDAEAILGRGAMTPAERARLIQSTRVILLMIQ
ncbi:M20/M25/M40 family metallo-hydrolase [Aquisphaera insulae]|uniref:M20/M25/M40 family metallo-hydrolase n=1 Tax=Aquisphaera insulae TaxID=2712864 RepID=UPI0013ED2307|nr:M20/M25/M40 family metallo-hydrolase [Aquisphaera insulae]